LIFGSKGLLRGESILIMMVGQYGQLTEGKVLALLHLCEKRLRENPNNADALFTKAVVLAKMQKFEDSIDCLDKVISIDPEYPAVDRLKMTVLRMMREGEPGQPSSKEVEIIPPLKSELQIRDQLREAEKKTGKAEDFKKLLEEAFAKFEFGLGRVSEEPWILLEIPNHTVAVYPISAREGIIGEEQIDLSDISAHKKQFEADCVAVVSSKFSAGKFRGKAEEMEVKLIETEAICKALENHALNPYDLQEIYSNLFGNDKFIITEKDIRPSMRNIEKLTNIIGKLLSLKNIKSFTIEKIHFALNAFSGLDCEEKEVEAALRLLSTPPFDIVRKDGEAYTLVADVETILKRLSILQRAIERREAS